MLCGQPSSAAVVSSGSALLQPVELDEVEPVVLVVSPRMPVVPEVEPVEVDPDDELLPDEPDVDAVCAETSVPDRISAPIARAAVRGRMVSPFMLIAEARAIEMVSGHPDTVA